MTRSRLLQVLIVAIAFVIGSALGFGTSQYFALVSDFPRVMVIRSLVVEASSNAPPRLLDLYENEINRQNVWFGFSRFNWNQELIDISLRRYIPHSNLGQNDLAQVDLARAAGLRRRGISPSKDDLEFERRLANKLYGHEGH